LRFRAFIAVDIEPEQALVAQLRELASSRADIKVVKPALLHVTLKFLGDAEETLVDEIVRRMADSAKGVSPFQVRLTGLGAFPSMSNIRVVWVGIKDGAKLGEIAGRLDASFADIGFEREKKGFVPHLTLARARSGQNMGVVQEMLKRNAATDFGGYPVDKILLKKSVLSPQGPAYSVVREVRLEPAGTC
jgi:2'-5' RNA ligase